MRVFLASLLVLLLTQSAFAQKEANVWHFGNGQCLDFSSGTPVQIAGSAIQTFEGSASYCDPQGRLLFYTNGGGREPALSGQDGGHIWDRNNGVMYDMQGVEGGGFSAAQSSVIVEAPGQPGVYYVFTMEEVEFYVGASAATAAAQPLGRGLSYFTVDMSLNGGLGGVALADQRVYVPSYEGLCAIKHANGRDYWIIINQDSSGIGVYSVTPSGVAFSSLLSGTSTFGSYLKASPDGSKLTCGLGLLDFDNSTGVLSNLQALPPASYYEFSHSGYYLYAASQDSIYRYDLLAPSIPASQQLIGTINTTVGWMQLAPDGKIYFLTSFGPQIFLNSIDCPNTQSPSIQQNQFTYNDNFYTLPNFPAWIFLNTLDNYVDLGPDTMFLCPGDTLILDAQNPGASYAWSTPDTTRYLTVTQPGLYSVTVNSTCGAGSDQVAVVACTTNTLSQCVEFLPTGAPQSWTVPAGVDSIRVKMWGAAGGGGPDSTNNAGGGGGYTEFTLPVVAGDVLQIAVGSGGQAATGHTGGAGGWPAGGSGGSGDRVETVFGIPTDVGGAGGGGGLSLVRILGSQNAILGIAGGGGGAAFNRSGGGGGGLEGEYTTATNTFNLMGFGGTQTAGGAPASNTICPHPVSGTAGGYQQGGTGATDIAGTADRTGGGGGGDGYYGGGGGGSQDGCFGVGSAGGGGSGYVCTTCTGLTGFTQTAGFFGTPANETDPLLFAYPGTATGVFSENGGGGLVQICYNSCTADTDSIAIASCASYTDPLGTIYSQSGTYTFSLTNAGGCDSLIVLDLVIQTSPVQTPVQTVSVCDSFTSPTGTVYTTSGIYTDTIFSVSGCDTLLTFDVTVLGTITGAVITTSACNSYVSPGGNTYTQTGIYSDTLSSALGCDSVVTVDLTITGAIAGATINPTACYSYLSPAGNTLTQTGIYYDTLITSAGCDSVVTIDLIVFGASQGSTLTVSECTSYLTPSGQILTQSGVYTDTIPSAAGCDSIIPIDLTIVGILTGPSQSVVACTDYLSPSGTAYTQSATISDTISALNGCDSVIVINLTITGLPAATFNNTASACDSATGTLNVSASGGTAGYTYAWSPGGQTTALVTDVDAGNYSVTVTDANGCSNSFSTVVNNLPSAPVTISASTTFVLAGDPVQLQAIGSESYSWSPASGLSCTACADPTALPLQPVTYTVIATDENGCTSTAQITIDVEVKCGLLFVPTVFSPNKQGLAVNEQVCVLGACIDVIEFKIYDRWGKAVFESEDPALCWDGTVDGKEAAGGVYVYSLKAILTDGSTVTSSGNITLVR